MLPYIGKMMQKRLVAKALTERLGAGKQAEVILAWMADEFHYNKTSNVSNDPIHLSFNEGRRSAFLEIIKMMKTDLSELNRLIDDGQAAINKESEE